MLDPSAYELGVTDLDRLLALLADDGYNCLGPTVRDGAIVYAAIASTADLPRGWTDEQAPGHYRLRRRDDDALFGYNVGPQAWKQFLFPPRERVWQMSIDGQAFVPAPDVDAAARHAFIGVRACELAAIGVQDRVFGGRPFHDDAYLARRAGAFVVAVNCVEAGGTCFCADMGTGPAVEAGHDIALTELLGGDAHRFLAVAGSERGAALLERLGCGPAAADLASRAAAGIEHARTSMGRRLDTAGLPALLARSLDSPHWETVAERCLACANCTAVCPTCFCSSVEDTADLDGGLATRWRQWDSCFNPGFSYLHGGEVRRSTAARYRQWLTHKLGTWHDQFGSSGCVGCGRCISWCPVGIDITAEATGLRERDAHKAERPAAAART
ncbi:MAG: 4Fe-4S dicluster domain-containing protein [Gammaproteobacteria bacterium]|nr:4Fe-4S dicluster domain-containing protein [Gammaproteobacteria bacterium]